MPTKTFQTLLARAHSQFGYLTPSDATAVGVQQSTLRSMASRGQVEHIARGIYRMPDVPSGPLDPYMETALRVGDDAVLSHETALELYAICDVNPPQVHLTVPSSYRTKRILPGYYELHYEDLADDQLSTFDGLPIVTINQAIWGAIDNLAGEHLITQAIQNASSKGLLTDLEEQQLSGYKLLRFGGVLADA
jgi:predicted transcriptional regulator of viral defense system